MPSSAPTALAPCLPPQALVTTSAPLLWRRLGSYRTPLLGGDPQQTCLGTSWGLGSLGKGTGYSLSKAGCA